MHYQAALRIVLNDPDVELVVTDDRRDFRLLAADFRGRVISVADMIAELGG
ncbi:MAG TPA: hypothetical protein VMW62_17880 [Chloroflexota bacterium]|nr:hypothetical protein [Chloroflexota bacterium]